MCNRTDFSATVSIKQRLKQRIFWVGKATELLEEVCCDGSQIMLPSFDSCGSGIMKVKERVPAENLIHVVIIWSHDN